MIKVIRSRRNKRTIRLLSFFIAISFICSSVFPSMALASQLSLPASTQFVPLSENYSFPVLKGLKLDPSNPLHIEFIIDTAEQKKATEEEAAQLIRYFLAGLTIPEKDIWVNLSPYEQQRVINESLGQTDLGKDLLGQDYILKQLSSSLTYPESDSGKSYWTQIYSKVASIAHTTKLPINTFNKVWITPDKAEVYENKDFVIVTDAKLKVMLEEDYLALQNNTAKIKTQGSAKNLKEGMIAEINKASSGVTRDFILPQITNEVNSGKNFATLRQIYHSLILGIWFKQKFQDSIYKAYINQAKIKGIDLADKGSKEQIYNLYVDAFKKGIYNYIKQDTDPVTNKKIKRQYFSGGFGLLAQGQTTLPIARATEEVGIAAARSLGSDDVVAGADFATTDGRGAEVEERLMTPKGTDPQSVIKAVSSPVKADNNWRDALRERITVLENALSINPGDKKIQAELSDAQQELGIRTLGEDAFGPASSPAYRSPREILSTIKYDTYKNSDIVEAARKTILGEFGQYYDEKTLTDAYDSYAEAYQHLQEAEEAGAKVIPGAAETLDLKMNILSEAIDRIKNSTNSSAGLEMGKQADVSSPVMSEVELRSAIQRLEAKLVQLKVQSTIAKHWRVLSALDGQISSANEQLAALRLELEQSQEGQKSGADLLVKSAASSKPSQVTIGSSSPITEEKKKEYLGTAKQEIDKYLNAQFAAKKISEEIFKKAMAVTYANLESWAMDKDIARLSPKTQVAIFEAIEQSRWKDIVEVFRQDITFGTAGIRGKAALTLEELLRLKEQGPKAQILKGPNTINDIVLLRYTTGVIRYAKEKGLHKVAIGYDSRIAGEQFAEMIAQCFVAQSSPEHEFTIYLFDEASPFPELSFGLTTKAVRADLGILISASHNPSEYNGYKVTDNTGSQLPQRMKDEVKAAISKVTTADIGLKPLNEAKAGQLIWLGGKEPIQGKDYKGVDVSRPENFIDMHSSHVGQVKKFILDNAVVERQAGSLNIGFSAFNGSGNKAVPRLLNELGFTNVKVIEKLQELDGLFPAFGWGEQPDPGDPISADIAVREFIAEHGQEAFDKLDILIGTDPDADRMGLIVKVPESQQDIFGKYRLLSANDVWTLLIWYRLMKKQELGQLSEPEKHYITFSHVTTDALEQVAALFGVLSLGEMYDKNGTEERGNYLNGRRAWVGFTYIADFGQKLRKLGLINEGGAEESNGFSILGGPVQEGEVLASDGHVNDKDGTFAGVLLAEVASYAKDKNTTLFELLDKIYLKIGHYSTANKSLPRVGSFEGAEGVTEKINLLKKAQDWMRQSNERANTANPFVLGGQKVVGAIEFKSGRYDEQHYVGFPDEGVRFFFEDANLKDGEPFHNSKNYITIRPSGTSQAIRFYTQINSAVLGQAIAKQKLANYVLSEQIALKAQKELLTDAGVVKYVPNVEDQLSKVGISVSSPITKDQAWFIVNSIKTVSNSVEINAAKVELRRADVETLFAIKDSLGKATTLGMQIPSLLKADIDFRISLVDDVVKAKALVARGSSPVSADKNYFEDVAYQQVGPSGVAKLAARIGLVLLNVTSPVDQAKYFEFIADGTKRVTDTEQVLANLGLVLMNTGDQKKLKAYFKQMACMQRGLSSSAQTFASVGLALTALRGFNHSRSEVVAEKFELASREYGAADAKDTILRLASVIRSMRSLPGESGASSPVIALDQAIEFLTKDLVWGSNGGFKYTIEIEMGKPNPKFGKVALVGSDHNPSEKTVNYKFYVDPSAIGSELMMFVQERLKREMPYHIRDMIVSLVKMAAVSSPISEWKDFSNMAKGRLTIVADGKNGDIVSFHRGVDITYGDVYQIQVREKSEVVFALDIFSGEGRVVRYAPYDLNQRKDYVGQLKPFVIEKFPTQELINSLVIRKDDSVSGKIIQFKVTEEALKKIGIPAKIELPSGIVCEFVAEFTASASSPVRNVSSMSLADLNKERDELNTKIAGAKYSSGHYDRESYVLGFDVLMEKLVAFNTRLADINREIKIRSVVSSSPVGVSEILSMIQDGDVSKAIRLFTQNRSEFSEGEIERIVWAIDTNYKGPVAVVGKLGGSTMAFEGASSNGLLGYRVGDKTTYQENKQDPAEEVIGRIVASIKKVIDKYGASRVSQVYFSAPGAFKPDGTLLEDESNIPSIKAGFSFEKTISERLNALYPNRGDLGPISVKVEHDGTAGARGEMSSFGNYIGLNNLFYVIAGTGIGTRLMIDGKPFDGGEEVGYAHNEGPHHLKFNGNEQNPDYTYHAVETSGHFVKKVSEFIGAQDLEDRTSGPAIEKYAREVVVALVPVSADAKIQDKMDARKLFALAKENSGKLTTEVLGKAANRGNNLATRIIQDRARELGIGLAIMLMETDKHWGKTPGFHLPDVIIIGSGVSKIGSIFLEAVREGARARFEEKYKYLADKIDLSKIKDDTGREMLGGLPAVIKASSPVSAEYSKLVAEIQGNISRWRAERVELYRTINKTKSSGDASNAVKAVAADRIRTLGRWINGARSELRGLAAKEKIVPETEASSSPVGGISMDGIKVKAGALSTPVVLQALDLKGLEGLTFRIVKLEPIKNINLVLNLSPVVLPTSRKEQIQLAMAK